MALRFANQSGGSGLLFADQNETGGGNVVTALTGQQIAASQGSIIDNLSVQPELSGQEVTSAQGTLVAAGGAPNVTLTGLFVTTSVGLLQADGDGNVSIPLTGQEITASQGSLALFDHVRPLVGQQISSAIGSLSASTSSGPVTNRNVFLTGIGITASQGALTTVTDRPATVALTGQEIVASQGTIIFDLSAREVERLAFGDFQDTGPSFGPFE